MQARFAGWELYSRSLTVGGNDTIRYKKWIDSLFLWGVNWKHLVRSCWPDLGVGSHLQKVQNVAQCWCCLSWHYLVLRRVSRKSKRAGARWFDDDQFFETWFLRDGGLIAFRREQIAIRIDTRLASRVQHVQTPGPSKARNNWLLELEGRSYKITRLLQSLLSIQDVRSQKDSRSTSLEGRDGEVCWEACGREQAFQALYKSIIQPGMLWIEVREL